MHRGAPGLALARAAIVVDHLLQVIDAVEIDVGELRDLRLDVARHRDVDHEDRLVPALAHSLLHGALAEYRQLARRRADHDVGAQQAGRDLRQQDRLAGEATGHLLGARQRAVGDDEPRHAGLGEVARDQLDGFAGADQQRRGRTELGEDVTRELHRREGDRHRVLADRGFGAHLLRDREHVVHHPGKVGADGAGVARRGEGRLDLAEDLRLAHHHRIEPAGDLDQVAQGLGAAQAVQAALELAARKVVRAGEPVEHPLLGFGAAAGDRDELGTVAGRKNQRLRDTARCRRHGATPPGPARERMPRARAPRRAR